MTDQATQRSAARLASMAMAVHPSKLTTAEAERIAQSIDPKAEAIDFEGDRQAPNDTVLLIANEHVDAILALFPGSFPEPNDPPTSWTPVLLPMLDEEGRDYWGNR